MDTRVAASEEEPARKVLNGLLQHIADAAAACGETHAAFREFVCGCYAQSSPDALSPRSAAQLAATAQSLWQHARQRQAGEARVRVVPPSAMGGALACLQTNTADMPFLVDTVSIAVRAASSGIDWLLHPVHSLQRDAQGQITAVGQGQPESTIHVEFEPLADDAAYAALEHEVRDALRDLAGVVSDYPAIRERLEAVITALANVPPGADAAEFAEASAFLRYLGDHHFTFLGYVESRADAQGSGRIGFQTQRNSGLGLLRAGAVLDGVELIAPQQQLDKYADSPRLVVITKANLAARIHRAELMDSISVKRFDANGAVIGTVRFLGLFSSEVYIDRPREIPLIRRKAAHVIERAQLPEGSHAVKQLRDILHTLPRDELFQSSESELYTLCMGIRALRERQSLRLFVRRDRYGRFFSCLVYIPADRYSAELGLQIGTVLSALYGGLAVERHADAEHGSLLRLHYVLQTTPGTLAPMSVAEAEQRLAQATRSWREQLRSLLQGESAAAALRLADALPLSYQQSTTAEQAAADLAMLVQLSEAQPMLPHLLFSSDEDGLVRASELRLYALGAPLALSAVLPVLENFGLDVLSQDPAVLTPAGGPHRHIAVFALRHSGSQEAAQQQRARFESALLQVWHGEADNDRLNRLVLGAGLGVRQVSLLRAIGKYLVQTGLPFGEGYMAGLLTEHPAIARHLVQAFELRFALGMDSSARRNAELATAQALDHALDQVQSLDADRVLRAYLAFVRACLRTNYYQRRADGGAKHYISFKLDPDKIPELPLPRPKFEIWVCAPEVEGVHLRGGKVARGGLRWSDRRQDFRTEVLGLMKAQMVKNAVIVPVGAKGGFYVKKGPPPSERDAWLANGIECYKTFLRGLLDLTDNRVGDAIIAPVEVLRHDDDDPYLVVAADKGTATFSDIANGISAEYGFWLGDAFASGGSAGYDHKKMGITARGAWESIKRHFRELLNADGSPAGRDIQNERFTAVGIGDMSGDVFGNGALLSRHMQLLAAFDHRHIFIDPNPDPELSYAERARLFQLPRSSWADYDAGKISAGGGVYARSAKLVKLSDEARAALGITETALTPNDLIRAILKAPVDLLFNGGIGTYVKAATQTHQDVGDRANDAVRVNGRELRAKVVGEGGNLGCTQLGRIEYALNGGRINTDAIDNAGGVHTSDREVNIKIPLNQLMAAGALTRAERDPLLAECTDAIAQFVLRDNYVQSAALSLLEADAPRRLPDHVELMRMLEREGLLNRAIEFLPDEDALKERRARGLGLTRPELAVLIAYAKISLFDALLDSDMPDDPFFVRDLLANFPQPLVQRHGTPLSAHRLKREIIATMLCNAIVNRMGAGFAHLWADDHGLRRAEVVKAYATAHQIFDGDSYWRAIESLDNRVPAAVQYRLMARAIGLFKHMTGWITQSRHAALPVHSAVTRYSAPVAELAALLPACLPPGYRADWQHTVDEFVTAGVPEALAMRLASTRALGAALDIAELAEDGGLPLAEAAAIYYLVGEHFDLLWLYAAINELPADDKWKAMARVNLRDEAYLIHRQLAAGVVACAGDSAQARFAVWLGANERGVAIALARLAELHGAATRNFEALAVAVREIRKLG